MDGREVHAEEYSGSESEVEDVGKESNHGDVPIIDANAFVAQAFAGANTLVEDDGGEKFYEKMKIEDASHLLPIWLQFARIKPEKKYWKRRFLGGNENAFSVISFVLDLFHARGTVLRRCILPALTSACVATGLVMVRRFFWGKTFMALSSEFFLPFFMISLFVVAFRLFGAWYSYRTGHEMALQIVSNAVDCLLTCTTSLHIRNSSLDVLELVRRLNILLAFIRQDLRESRHHRVDVATFKAGSKKGRLAKEWFFDNELKFVEDPYGAPPLKLLLNGAEQQIYKDYSPPDRILVCIISIRTLFARHVHFGELKMSTPDSKVFQNNVQGIIHCYGRCRELLRTPAPFVLHHFGLVLLFFSTHVFGPLYFVLQEGNNEKQDFFAIAASFAFAFSFYGIEEAACEMEVPFGWRQTDCNLTKMCRSFLKHSFTFCKILNVKN